METIARPYFVAPHKTENEQILCTPWNFQKCNISRNVSD